ncbi:GNAT family N-acetyltransferase [Salinisphaera sp. Q1T1-3]|uniref:GNAT family N-acetyltransferase n=1 Tax=Salinisphaera sp. Q1T1-3 TaxID=2321229 RepID=UPI000E70D06C|nr:GNAT family N-acetyltransferase [Salinisphaera sp. Q1T1-3]RJS94764.1 N-acetyltransferase [Salinisphaera sp. Q1T1-3]
MSRPDPIATRAVPAIGCLEILPFCAQADAPTAHRWLTDPHARFWGMGDNTPADTRRYFDAIDDAATHEAWLGRCEGVPRFLVEVYDPRADAIGAYYDVAPGDTGMHILIAPPERRIPGFTWAVFAFVVDTLFARADVARLVVEPDIANDGIHPLNERAGFSYVRHVDMGDKTAAFSVCTRAAHAGAMQSLSPAHARAACREPAVAVATADQEIMQ